MELNPILERGDFAKLNLWYVISPEGEGPSVRVGSCCCVVKNGGKCGQIVITGGGNPDGPFDEVFILDLDTFSWTKKTFGDLKARYEHSSFVPESYPDNVVIFGGAQQSANLNDIQILDLGTDKCSTPNIEGTPPSPRTCHSMASVGDKLYIYSGGESGALAVSDQKLRVYDAASKSWQSPSTKGVSPSPRHGHVVVSVGPVLYVHGGMDGAVLKNDIFSFNTENSKWSLLDPKGCVPCARAAHSGVAVNQSVYIFGGMTLSGALNDLHCLNTETLTWTKIGYSCAPPSSRLDHAMCVVDISPSDQDVSLDEKKDQNKSQKLLLIFGGMDTHGEIFNDCLVFRIE